MHHMTCTWSCHAGCKQSALVARGATALAGTAMYTQYHTCMQWLRAGVCTLLWTSMVRANGSVVNSHAIVFVDVYDSGRPG